MEMSAAAELTKETCMYTLERKYSDLPHRLLMCIWCLLPRDVNVAYGLVCVLNKHCSWKVYIHFIVVIEIISGNHGNT